MQDALEQAMKDLESQKSTPENPMKYWKDGDKEGIINLKSNSFSPEELKEALKKFKTSQEDSEQKPVDVRGKFRSYTELKEDLKEIELNMKTETEIVYDLIQKYQQPDLEEEKRINILTDLEYYLHQVLY